MDQHREAGRTTPSQLRASPRAWRDERLLVPAVVAAGATLRLVYYFSKPPFSADESSLALNVMHRSYGTVLERLDFNQAAPPGFLLLQKLIVEAVGPSTEAFRLLPLLASLGTLLLTYPVGRRLIGERAAILALALVAVSEPLISYGATNKQYSVDVGVALGLTFAALLYEENTSRQAMAGLALLGAAAVWFSHPAAFVLAGIGAASMLRPTLRKQWNRTVASAIVSSTWLFSFLIAYLVTRQSIEQVQASVATAGTSALFGENGSPGLLQRLGGIARNLLGIPPIQHSLRGLLAIAVMALVLLGAVALARRAPYRLILLVMPALLAAITAAAHLYLLYPRAFLFVIPFIALLAAEGADFATIRGNSRTLMLGATGICISLIIATSYAAIHRLRAHEDADVPEALRYLAANASRGDSLYIYAAGQYDFRYYMESGFAARRLERHARAIWPIRPAAGYDQFAPALRSAGSTLVVGTVRSGGMTEYRRELRPLQGRTRVWIFISDADLDSRRALERALDELGTRLDDYPRSDPGRATLYLYDLRALA